MVKSFAASNNSQRVDRSLSHPHSQGHIIRVVTSSRMASMSQHFVFTIRSKSNGTESQILAALRPGSGSGMIPRNCLLAYPGTRTGLSLFVAAPFNELSMRLI